MNNEIQLIEGDMHKDDRGNLSFVNDFDLANIRRMYIIEPANIDIIRAWQGHKSEWKYFHVTEGSFTIGLVKIDNWENPSKHTAPIFYTLNANTPSVLVVPGGYANGIKSNTNNSKLMVFSSSTMEEAKGDEFRFDINKWQFE